ncbi:MAG: (Fe-S)-binding protein [Bacteroidota bacterium]
MMEKLNEEKIRKALDIVSANDPKLVTSLNSCVHCGLCAKSCVFYLAFNDSKYIPAHKVEIVSSVYRRYCTLTGRTLPFLVNARKMDDKLIEEMVDILYGGCTMCGRCVKHCSIGVDIEYVVRRGRTMLADMGYVPATLQATVNAALETGNNMAIPEDEFLDTIQWMEEEMQDDLNDPEAKIPVNIPDMNVLYTINPREPKFFPLSIAAMAKVFYAAGETWTISTQMYDVTNYGYFSSNEKEAAVIAQRLYDEVINMRVKTLALGECGHGSRAGRWEAPNYIQMKFPVEAVTSVELMARYIREGRIKVDKSKNTKKVTLHDPCNLVRGGGVFEEQRYILGMVASDFVEMVPFGYDNYCCGGGGGHLSMSEYNDRRMKTGELKAKQIRDTGAQIVITPCHNCVDQLIQLNVAYKLNVEIKTVAEIVADALVFENNAENNES